MKNRFRESKHCGGRLWAQLWTPKPNLAPVILEKAGERKRNNFVHPVFGLLAAPPV